MQTWAPILLGNTMMAGALAIVAIIVMRLRRPAIAHALWLLVLIKLVTPPIWNVPIPRPTWQVNQPSPVVARVEADTVPQTIHFTAPSEMVETTVTIPEGGTLILGSGVPAKKPFQWPSIDSVLIALWIGGSILWLLILGVRMRRFSRLARSTASAPSDIQQRADLLAHALDMPASPPVELVPASISPMLWHDIRSTRLLVPEQLLRTLDSEQRDALLLHELAHLKRRDHLTRFLEIVITAIFWWHPLVWIARRGLREAEEQCCDAWVIWAMPDSARRYADALVDTLDFLAASPLSLPPGASGLGGLHQLQRRLTMIFTHTPPRTLSGAGRIAILALLGLVPLGPVWSQEPPSQPVPIEQPRAAVERAPAASPAPARTAAEREQMFILTGINRTQTSLIAIIDNVISGQRAVVKVGDKIAGGEIQRISTDEISFLREGATDPTRVKMGNDLTGGLTDEARTRLARLREDPSRIADATRVPGPAETVRPNPLVVDYPANGLTVEQELRVRRSAALARQARGGPVILRDANAGETIEQPMQLRRDSNRPGEVQVDVPISPEPVQPLGQVPAAGGLGVSRVAAQQTDRLPILATASQQQPMGNRDRLERGINEFQNGRFEEALADFQQVKGEELGERDRTQLADYVGRAEQVARPAVPIAPSAAPAVPAARAASILTPGRPAGAAFVLTGIKQEGDNFTAYVEDLPRGGLTQLRIGDAIAGGSIVDIQVEGMRFQPEGTAPPVWVRVGSNLAGEPVGSIAGYRRALDPVGPMAAGGGGRGGRVRTTSAPTTQAVLDALIGTLRDRDATVRQATARGLGHMGPAAQGAMADLMRLLNDTDAGVRAAAAEAMGQIQGGNGRTFRNEVTPWSDAERLGANTTTSITSDDRVQPRAAEVNPFAQ